MNKNSKAFKILIWALIAMMIIPTFISLIYFVI